MTAGLFSKYVPVYPLLQLPFLFCVLYYVVDGVLIEAAAQMTLVPGRDVFAARTIRKCG